MQFVSRYIKLAFSLMMLFSSYVLYAFVATPNSTDGATGFIINPKNIFLYEVMPFVVAILLTFAAYWIYFRKLPLRKGRLSLFFEITNIFVVLMLIVYGVFVLTGTGNWYGGHFITAFSLLLLALSIIPIYVRLRRK